MRMVAVQDARGDEPDELLTGEVAKLADKSPDTVRRWERTGRIRARRTATGVRIFSRSEVLQFIRECSAEREARRCERTAAAAVESR